jgi:hypothetical protein
MLKLLKSKPQSIYVTDVNLQYGISYLCKRMNTAIHIKALKNEVTQKLAVYG